jgi:hypothetical protein
MRTLLTQLEQSLDAQLYFLSLFGALAIPDIAGALESEDGQASPPKYMSWFDKYVRPQAQVTARHGLLPEFDMNISFENPLTGEACYRFRCSLLHQGSARPHPRRSPYKRLIFIEPGAADHVVMHCNINDALMIDVRTFCREMIAGTKEWLEAVEHTEKYAKNYELFAKRHPQGLSPYVGGVAVVG